MRFVYRGERPDSDVSVQLIGDEPEVQRAEKQIICYALGRAAAKWLPQDGLVHFCTSLIEQHLVERVRMPYFADFIQNGIRTGPREAALVEAAVNGYLTSAQLHEELGRAFEIVDPIVNTAGLALDDQYQVVFDEIRASDIGEPAAAFGKQIGATHWASQSELVERGGREQAYTLASNRDHCSLGRMEDGEFQPMATYLSDNHPLAAAIFQEYGSNPGRNLADMPTLDSYPKG